MKNIAGHFLRKIGKPRKQEYHYSNSGELFFGIDKRAFITSCADEQKTFTRQDDREKVLELVTYVICRVKEEIRESPRAKEFPS